MKKRYKAVLALSAVALAACSSTSSSTSSTSPSSTKASATSSSAAKTGTVMFSGQTTSIANAPVVPLNAAGLFTDTGSITLSGQGNGNATLKFSHGNLTVYHYSANPNGTQTGNPTTCAFSGTSSGTFKVVSGTGSYAGTTGSGTFKVTFTGMGPKLSSGACNQSQSAAPTSMLTVFRATGTLTLK